MTVTELASRLSQNRLLSLPKSTASGECWGCHSSYSIVSVSAADQQHTLLPTCDSALWSFAPLCIVETSLCVLRPYSL